MTFLAGVVIRTAFAQSVTDSTGDIHVGDPAYLDLYRVRVRQVTDKIQIDFYPTGSIPGGNQAGITTTTLFEFYMDTDGDPSTGARLDDIGCDYKLQVDLFAWNGKSWIDGDVYWGFDAAGNWSKRGGFFVFAADLISQRFRWEFSLISLKWSQIDWVTRIYYRDHWTERVPDTGHASLLIDTSRVADIDSIASEFIQIVYPKTFQSVLDTYDVLRTVDSGARIESALCGTQFEDRPLRVMFNPWINGVAYAGNPVMIGSWSWREEPSWFMYFHELGHNFTLAADRFRKLYPGGGYTSIEGDDWHFGTNFAEAWATMVGLYAMREMYTRPLVYGISPAAVQNLQKHFQETSNNYSSALKRYEEMRDHSHLYPDVLDGIFLALADSFGYNIIRRWFSILQPPNAPWSRLNLIRPTTDYVGAKIASFTITACAFSAAAGTDLKSMFIDRWDFPIDARLYDQIRPEIEQMINTATGIGHAEYTPPPGLAAMESFPNPTRSHMTIVFELSGRSSVHVAVYNILGQLVDRVDAGSFSPGTHRLLYNASGLSNGVYFYSLITADGVRTKKILVAK